MTQTPLAREILAASPFSATEVWVLHAESGLTRYGDNHVTQNVESDTTTVLLRAIENGRTARVEVDPRDQATIRAGYERLAKAIKVLPESPEAPAPFRKPGASQATRLSTAPEAPSAGTAALAIALAAKSAATDGLQASGAHSWDRTTRTLANSEGLMLEQTTSDSEFACTIEGKGGAGRGFSSHADSSRLAIEPSIQRALAKCRASVDPRAIDPGSYTVVLEPAAVAELVSVIGYFGLSAKAYDEDRSFCRGKLGERILDERITLADDPLDERIAGLPFDYEGTPKRRVEFVSRGILRELASDQLTAARLKRESTGHGYPQPSSSDPSPWNLSLDWHGDTAPTEELISRVKRGILVTQLHYVNAVDPMIPSFTGMTRNGTFLIENGKIVAPVRNMRFTQSALEVFGGIRCASVERERVSMGSGMAALFPAVLADGFHFTSATGF